MPTARKLSSILIVLLTVFSVESHGQEGFDFSGVRYSEYRGVKKIAEHIIRTYPPGEFHYVGLGASPSGILAFLQLKIGEGAVTHLPMTSVGLIGHRHYAEQAQSNEFKDVIRKHFDHFLPSDKYSGKKVLVFDFTDKGSSLSIATDLLSDYFLEKGLGNILKSLALVRKKNLEALLTHRGIDVFRLSARMHSVFMNHGFDRYRKYEKINLLQFNRPEDYRPPKEVVFEWSRDEYLEALRKKHFVPRTYEHLLFEMQRFIKSDLLSLQFYRNLVHPVGVRGSLSCRQIFSSP